MKKFLTTFATTACMILAASCSNDEPSNVSPLFVKSSDDIVSFSSKRTIDEAAKIAADAIGMLPQGDSRSGARNFSKENVKYGISNSYSRSVGDTIMYVFNFDDNQGFAVVAADKNKQGLIAVTESGSYDPDVTPDNPGLALYMDAAKQYLANPNSTNSSINPYFTLLDSLKDTRNDKEFAQYKIVTDTLSHIVKHANINLNWGQNYPEGSFITTGPLGCVNTAAMIIMAYAEKPTSMTLTQPGYYGTEITIDWNKIKIHTISERNGGNDSYDNCFFYQTDNHTKLAMIGKELYVRNKTYPKETGNGYIASTNHFNMAQTLTDFNIGHGDETDYNDVIILNHIKSGNIIYIYGKDATNSLNFTYHAWIIDGVEYIRTWSGEYIKNGSEPWVLANDHGISSIMFVHLNWGHNGNGNGMFFSDILDTDKIYKYDYPNRPHPTREYYINLKIIPFYI